MRSLFLPISALFLITIFAIGCKGGIKDSSNSDIASLPRTSYSMGGVAFSLANFVDLDVVNRDSVSWSHLLPQTEENAPIVYYFATTDRSLSAPHIRLEYIDKKIENMESTANIFGWLRTAFLNEYQNGVILNEGEHIETMDGEQVEILEIHRPGNVVNDSITRGDKLMAWGYFDQQERFVGINFSATQQDDYDKGLPLFKDLIRSYKSK